MISSVLAVAMAASMQPADTTRAAREAFTGCLRTYVDRSVTARMPAAEFATAYPQQCSAAGGRPIATAVIRARDGVAHEPRRRRGIGDHGDRGRAHQFPRALRHGPADAGARRRAGPRRAAPPPQRPPRPRRPRRPQTPARRSPRRARTRLFSSRARYSIAAAHAAPVSRSIELRRKTRLTSRQPSRSGPIAPAAASAAPISARSRAGRSPWSRSRTASRSSRPIAALVAPVAFRPGLDPGIRERRRCSGGPS